jgi:hypothetical protein
MTMLEKIKWGFVAAIFLYGLMIILVGSVNPTIPTCGPSARLNGPICVDR